MSVCLKDYEYKIRVISADEQEAVELKESVKALEPYQLYVLIEAKMCSNMLQKLRNSQKESFVVNQNLICLAEGKTVAASSEEINNQIPMDFDSDESNKKLLFVSRKQYCHCGWINSCLKNWGPTMLQNIQDMNIILTWTKTS